MADADSNADSARLRRLKALLGQTWRIAIRDGRVFLGTLVCTDKERNAVLTNADEYRPGEWAGGGRYVGMVMVPWRWVVRAEVEWGAYVQSGEGAGAGEGEGVYT